MGGLMWPAESTERFVMFGPRDVPVGDGRRGVEARVKRGAFHAISRAGARL